jgi:hypothetical protein
MMFPVYPSEESSDHSAPGLQCLSSKCQILMTHAQIGNSMHVGVMAIVQLAVFSSVQIVPDEPVIAESPTDLIADPGRGRGRGGRAGRGRGRGRADQGIEAKELVAKLPNGINYIKRKGVYEVQIDNMNYKAEFKESEWHSQDAARDAACSWILIVESAANSLRNSKATQVKSKPPNK